MPGWWDAFARRAPDADSAFLVVLFVSVLVAGLGATLDDCVERVWTDFLHFNPYRPTSNAVEMMLLSPIYGYTIVLFLGGFPIVIGAVLSALAVLASGRLSRMGITAVAVVCAVVFVHGCYIGAEESAKQADWRQTSPPWSTLVGGIALLTASLLCGRWVFERAVRGAADAVDRA